MNRRVRLSLEPPLDPPMPQHRPCAYPDCREAGLHRAPKARDRLNEYLWFCLGHVRAYNQAWNYYEGMDEAEIEAHIRSDTIWHRPSWPLGHWAHGPATRIRSDGFGFFPDDGLEDGIRPRFRPLTAEEEALAVLELQPPVTLKEIKIRYKILVKRLHPDANGGDKAAEERLKCVNQAYSTLKSVLPY